MSQSVSGKLTYDQIIKMSLHDLDIAIGDRLDEHELWESNSGDNMDCPEEHETCPHYSSDWAQTSRLIKMMVNDKNTYRYIISMGPDGLVIELVFWGAEPNVLTSVNLTTGINPEQIARIFLYWFTTVKEQ